MAKRFTDTNIYLDEWYRGLKPVYKCFWDFLYRSCDQAGFWKKDYKLAYMFIGAKFSAEEALEKMNEGKLRIIDHGEYLDIVDFVSFQYGVLNDNCKPHTQVIGLLEKYQSKGYTKGIQTLKDKDKDKDKDKNNIDTSKLPLSGAKDKKLYLDFVKLTDVEHKKIVDKIGSVLAQKYIQSLNNYIGQKGDKYKSHAHTIDNWYQKDLEAGKIKVTSHATVESANETLAKVERWKRGEE